MRFISPIPFQIRGLEHSSTYSWLSADLRRTGSLLPVEVSLDWVIKEQVVLVEVVLGLLFSHADGLGEGLSWRLQSKEKER